MAFGPYSSRNLNKHVQYGFDPKSGEKMVMKTQFVTSSDAFKGGKEQLPDRWKYSKWQSPRKPQNAGNGYFGWPPGKGSGKDATFKAFEYPGGGGPSGKDPKVKLEYNDKTSYLKAKRPASLSFQSKDASRRDEFSSVIRTQQYREALKAETRLMGSGKNQLADDEILARAAAAEKGRKTFVEGLNEVEFLYDVGRNNFTLFDPHDERDHFYTQTRKAMMHRKKRHGSTPTISSAFGDFGDFKPGKSEFGRLHTTKVSTTCFVSTGHSCQFGL